MRSWRAADTFQGSKCCTQQTVDSDSHKLVRQRDKDKDKAAVMAAADGTQEANFLLQHRIYPFDLVFFPFCRRSLQCEWMKTEVNATIFSFNCNNQMWPLKKESNDCILHTVRLLKLKCKLDLIIIHSSSTAVLLHHEGGGYCQSKTCCLLKI